MILYKHGVFTWLSETSLLCNIIRPERVCGLTLFNNLDAAAIHIRWRRCCRSPPIAIAHSMTYCALCRSPLTGDSFRQFTEMDDRFSLGTQFTVAR